MEKVLKNNMGNLFVWSDDAAERLDRVPSFLRDIVRRSIENLAIESGFDMITNRLLSRFRDETLNIITESRRVWTEEAAIRLSQMPEFMREMAREIIEESAAEFGYKEINMELIEKLEKPCEDNLKSKYFIKWLFPLPLKVNPMSLQI